MSEYFGEFVSEMPQDFTPVRAYAQMSGLGTDKVAPVSAAEKKTAEQAEMIKNLGPLIEQAGPIVAMAGPAIAGLIKSMGTAALPLVMAMPLPQQFKDDFKKMSQGVEKKVQKQLAPTSEKSNMVPIAVGVGVAGIGIALVLSLKK